MNDTTILQIATGVYFRQRGFASIFNAPWPFKFTMSGQEIQDVCEMRPLGKSMCFKEKNRYPLK